MNVAEKQIKSRLVYSDSFKRAFFFSAVASEYYYDDDEKRSRSRPFLKSATRDEIKKKLIPMS